MKINLRILQPKTKTKTTMKIENFKMKVTPEQSKRVQEVCGVSHDWKADYIIWYGAEMKFCITRDHFDAHPHAELTYAEFMAKYAPEGPERIGIMARDEHNPSFPPKQDEVTAPPRIDPAHLAIAFRILPEHGTTDQIAELVNLMLSKEVDLRDLAELEAKWKKESSINHPSKG